MQTIGKLFIKDDAILLIARSTPAWWRQAGESSTKQLYQPEPKPVTYVVPTTSMKAPSHMNIWRESVTVVSHEYITKVTRSIANTLASQINILLK